MCRTVSFANPASRIKKKLGETGIIEIKWATTNSMPIAVIGSAFATTMTGCACVSDSRSCSEEPKADSMDLLPEEASKVTDFLSKSAAVNGTTTSSLSASCSETS